MIQDDDYNTDIANDIAMQRFGLSAWVLPEKGRFAVVRFEREFNEAVRPAGACRRTVLGRGQTRREALENAGARVAA